ncbi:MAG TPA: 50S ribosomal protein L25 [Acidobacteriaceae bacterium]|jgi:large subunit ribosomal protein L25|nr:50S ribosomal protein L25 [Acidobacteriaceae bacterium]
MITQETVSAMPREGKFNKNAARRVRAKGKVPAVVYGAAEPAVAVEVDPKQIQKILHSESGHNSIFDLEVAGNTAKVMIVDWQYEPIKGQLIHIDFKRIALDKPIRVEVPIQLMGLAEGVKTQGGILDQTLREVEIECLPGDIPANIPLDVTALVFGTVLRVSDLPHGGKLKFLTPEDTPIAHITSVKEEVAPTPEAEAAATGAAPAEPEVVKKGKQETEGAAAAPAGEKGAGDKGKK